jgi:hypothetical protein
LLPEVGKARRREKGKEERTGWLGRDASWLEEGKKKRTGDREKGDCPQSLQGVGWA